MSGFRLRIEAQQYGQIARALKSAGDRDLRLAVFRSIRQAGRPLGQSVVRDGSAQMPHRGGLSARVAASKVSISATAGATARVRLHVRSPEGDGLPAMDAGLLRHPVFARAGHSRTWVQQTVRAGAFTDAFQRGAPLIRTQVVHAAQGVLDDIARKA